MSYLIRTIPQLGVGTFSDGTLISERHVTCYNLILYNCLSQSALMCHVHEQPFMGLSPAQIEAIDVFTLAKGDIFALRIMGCNSQYHYDVDKPLSQLGIHMLPQWCVKTFKLSWNVTFHVNQNTLLITNELGKTLARSRPFPKHTQLNNTDKLDVLLLAQN